MTSSSLWLSSYLKLAVALMMDFTASLHTFRTLTAAALKAFFPYVQDKTTSDNTEHTRVSGLHKMQVN